MKIVCMIGTPPYLHYFVNTIAKHHPVACVIREDAHTGGGLMRKIRSKGLAGVVKIIVNRVRNRKKVQSDYNRFFGKDWQTLSSALSVVTTESINSDAVRSMLQELKPDLVLVHGTTLIKKSTLQNLPLVLNLHWGLSPYYKGSYCTSWALLNHDPLNIGFTIHQITPKIDGGDVLTQGRVLIEPGDTVNSINMRLTKEGTHAMVKVIERLASGEPPVFQSQDETKGRLYLVKHWTTKQEQFIRQMEKNAAVEEMLQHPATPELPIVQW